MIIRDVWITPPAGSAYRCPFVDYPFQTSFPIDGPRWEHFALTASDYDVGDDQMQCPCGDVMDRPMTLGEMREVAEAHIAEKHRRPS